METASDSNVTYKSITGQLKEHFGFVLNADNKTVAMENVCCMCCYKEFAYHKRNVALRR